MFYLALKQMLSRKRQTLLIFLGISFGTMIYVIIAGLQFGFRGFLTEQLLNNSSHILIKGNDRNIEKNELRDRFFKKDELVNWIVAPQGKREEARLENPQAWFERLSANPKVMAFAPRLTVNAIATQGRFRANVVLSGVIPSKQIKVTSLEDYMVEGSMMDLEGGGNKVILGKEVLEDIGAKVNDIVRISTGLGEPRPFKVVGSISLGNEDLDKTLAFGNIKDTQNLNRTPGRVGEISVALTDMEQSQHLADHWNAFSRDKVQSWQEANAQFMQMIEIQDIMRAVMVGTILLVAAFGIYNTLSIMIAQKRKEIAILRSIGYGPERILELFLYQGLIMGTAGAALGCVLGFAFNTALSSYKLGFEIGKSDTLPVSFAASIFATAFFMSIIAAGIASFLPARSASKLTPLDIFREEG